MEWCDGTKELACDAYGLLAKSRGIEFSRRRYERIEKIPFIPLEAELDSLIGGTGLKTATVLQLLKETGARIGEAWALKWTDIDITLLIFYVSRKPASKEQAPKHVEMEHNRMRKPKMTSIRNRLFKRTLLPIVIAIVAVATIATYVYAMPLLTSGLLKTPPELLTLDHYTITSDPGQQNPTVLTLWLRNDGASITTLSALSVHDENPSTSPVTFQLNGMTISPGTTKSVTVDTLGSNFYFSHGILYQATLVTSRTNLSYSINY